MPFSPFQFLLFVFLVVFLVAFVQVGLLTLAFDKLGISPAGGLTLLLASLFGSAINLPVARIHADDALAGDVPPILRGLLRAPAQPFTGETVIAVNLGGCIIPVLFSLHLLLNRPIDLVDLLLDEESTSLAELESFIGKPIKLQVETLYTQEQYDVVLI